MWGTYWEWDPRLTFELILLFQFLGYMALRSAIDDVQRADRVERGARHRRRRERADHSLFGGVVELAASDGVRDEALASPRCRRTCCIPLLMMFLGFTLLFVALLLTRLRAEVLSRERSASLDPRRGERMSVTEFFAMGGYARYVWPSYALVLGAIVLNIVWARRALKRARAEARRRLAMQGDAT